MWMICEVWDLYRSGMIELRRGKEWKFEGS